MRKKTPKEILLKLPDPLPYTSWVVVGFDLSTSRSGYAVGVVTESGLEVLKVGSVKPQPTSPLAPVWIRSNLTGKGLRDEILIPTVLDLLANGAGLLLCFEAATPRNDFLSSARNGALTQLFMEGSPLHRGTPTHILFVNASTLRSLMGLTKTGAKNKSENIAKALTFVDKSRFTEIDSDACDGILLMMMARYTAALLMGRLDELPIHVKNRLCDATEKVKGKGKRTHIVVEGVLNHPEYWTTYAAQVYGVMSKDASLKTKKLQRREFTL